MVKVGDKVKIVNADKNYNEYYENGAEGVVVAVDPTWQGVDVEFTYGFKLDSEFQPSRGFHVYHREYSVIGEKVKKKEKQVKDVGVVKVSAYSVVNTKTGTAVEICKTRESARFWLSQYKTHPRDHYHIVRLGPVAFTR